MDNDNKIVKYKVLIMIPCVSIQAWIKNNPDPIVDKENVEKALINIHAWILNHKNPTTEEELKKIRELKGSLNDSIINYCVLLNEEKANKLRMLKGKVNNNVFYFCENIVEFGWEKTKVILPTKVQEHNEWLEKTQGVPPHDDHVGGN